MSELKKKYNKNKNIVYVIILVAKLINKEAISIPKTVKTKKNFLPTLSAKYWFKNTKYIPTVAMATKI